MNESTRNGVGCVLGILALILGIVSIFALWWLCIIGAVLGALASLLAEGPWRWFGGIGLGGCVSSIVLVLAVLAR